MLAQLQSNLGMLSKTVLHHVQVVRILAALMYLRIGHPQHACCSVWSLIYASDAVCMEQSVHNMALAAH